MIATANLVELEGYVDDVIAGRIVAGIPVRQACERHRRDLAREGTDEFPFYFDRSAADGAIDFFPGMLCHSIGDRENQPFHLEPWQKFGVGSTFGWKRCEDNARRFRRILWQMGRKNGKTTLGAGICLLAASSDVNPVTRRPEGVADVIISATKRDQARVMYEEAARMRERSPWLNDMSEERAHFLRFHANQGKIRTVASDKSFDGLNPSLVALDEIHAFGAVQEGFYNTMQTGSGNRIQPLTVSFTTAGSHTSYIWLAEYEYAKGVLAGEHTDETLFAFIFEMDPKDDIFDSSLWKKSNPNLGISIQPDYLEQQANRLRTSAVGINTFKRYHANMLVAPVDQAFDVEDWDQCAGTLSDWGEADAIGAGFDLGSADDFSAWGVAARFETGELDEDELPVYRYEVLTQSYISSETQRDLTAQPWAEWIYKDLLHVRDSPNTALQFDLLDKCREYGVDSIAFDPWGGQHMAEQFQQRGIRIGKMPQNTNHFSEPIHSFRELLKERRITHDGNPMLRWMINNSISRTDHQEHEMLSKRDSKEKIDAVIAMLMAYRRAQMAKPKPRGSLFVT